MAKPSWITLSQSSGTGGGSVQVTASQNSGSSTRSGTLTVQTTSGLTKSVSLSQAYSRVIHYWATIEYLGASGSNYNFKIHYYSNPSFVQIEGDSGYLLVAPTISGLDSDLDLVFSDAGARIDNLNTDSFEVEVSVPQSAFIKSGGEPISPNELGWTVYTYSELENNWVDTQYIFDVDKSQYIAQRSEVYYMIYPANNTTSSPFHVRFKSSERQTGTFTVTIKYKTSGGSYSTTTLRLSSAAIGSDSYGYPVSLTGVAKGDVEDFDISISEVTGGSSANCDFIQKPAPNPIALTNDWVGSTSRTFSYRCTYTPLPAGLTMDVVDTENNQKDGIPLSTTGIGTFTVPKNDSEGTISKINSITIHPTAVMGCLEIILADI